jgi:hypothetical protein
MRPIDFYSEKADVIIDGRRLDRPVYALVLAGARPSQFISGSR